MSRPSVKSAVTARICALYGDLSGRSDSRFWVLRIAGDGGFGEVDDEQRLVGGFGREGVVVQVDDGGMQRLVFR